MLVDLPHNASLGNKIDVPQPFPNHASPTKKELCCQGLGFISSLQVLHIVFFLIIVTINVHKIFTSLGRFQINEKVVTWFQMLHNGMKICMTNELAHSSIM
jgi:hypothetical protein